jgi:hypothetical protein
MARIEKQTGGFSQIAYLGLMLVAYPLTEVNGNE